MTPKRPCPIHSYRRARERGDWTALDVRGHFQRCLPRPQPTTGVRAEFRCEQGAGMLAVALEDV